MLFSIQKVGEETTDMVNLKQDLTAGITTELPIIQEVIELLIKEDSPHKHDCPHLISLELSHVPALLVCLTRKRRSCGLLGSALGAKKWDICLGTVPRTIQLDPTARGHLGRPPLTLSWDLCLALTLIILWKSWKAFL